MSSKFQARFVTTFLVISALFSTLTGYSGLAAPVRFSQLLGYMLTGFDGRNEVRAQYGGFFLAIAAAVILALAGKVPRQAALILNAVLFGGLIAGRVLSLVIDGGMHEYGRYIQILFLIDATGFSLSLIALYLNRGSTSAV
jgi:hypothetical protein